MLSVIPTEPASPNLADVALDSLSWGDRVRMLFASVTFTYNCWANALFGTDCTAWCNEASTIEFPAESRV